MTIQKAVEDFIQLGTLPDISASEEVIALYQGQLQRIKRPVTDEEAALLVRCFGPDDCYGLAWMLLHLIETAPGGSPIKVQPSANDNEWIRYLWDRAHR